MSVVSPLSRRAGPLACVAALAAATSCTTSTIKPITHKSVVVPTKVPVQLTPAKNQHNFDAFSWKVFIALNWPALGEEPDPDRLIGEGADDPTVWEAWQSRDATFLPDGSKPVWGHGAPIPAACEGISGEELEVLSMSQLSGALVSSGQFNTGPLIDQHGQFVRYEIRINRPMFDYIVDNELYTRAGQKNHGKVFFPCSKGKAVGATMVKAAWKPLGPGDDPASFHVRKSLVYTPDPSAPDDLSKGSCAEQSFGLVGFHIASKTNDTPLWIWSTFEHTDNAPDLDDARGGQLPRDHYLFFAKDCRTEDGQPCSYNQVPVAVSPAQAPATPTQVVRNIPIPQGSIELNELAVQRFDEVLAGSRWSNYELISTQWPTVQSDKCKKIEGEDLRNWPTPNENVLHDPAPTLLANTTLETYEQGSLAPDGSFVDGGSSCMHCHLGATSTHGDFSDFTFILWEAQ